MNRAAPIQRILIAIDFSDPARAAFYSGIALATQLGAETFILHVSEPIRAFDFGKRRYIDTEDTIERVEEGVQRRVDELWENGGLRAVDRRRVHVIVRGGKPASEIIDAARAKQIDLIVMGASGAGAVADMLIGATSEKVVRNAPCSVLCVRNDPAPTHAAAAIPPNTEETEQARKPERVA